jgi:GcrA cell cycle regulator
MKRVDRRLLRGRQPIHSFASVEPDISWATYTPAPTVHDAGLRLSGRLRDSAKEAAMADAGVTWTAERVGLLRKLWSEGLSASQIAAELGGGVTRNAVISKAYRLGLVHGAVERPNTARSRKPSPPPDLPSTTEPSGQNAPGLTPTMVDPQPADEPEETRPREEALVPAQKLEQPRRQDAVVPLSKRVTIMELREAMCRWPLGDPTTPEFRYCGAQAIMGLPYCAHHAQVAYQPAAERKRLRA